MGIKELLKDKRDVILQIATKHGAHHVRVIGSVARGEARPDSDIDFLVDLDSDRSLMDHAAHGQKRNPPEPPHFRANRYHRRNSLKTDSWTSQIRRVQRLKKLLRIGTKNRCDIIWTPMAGHTSSMCKLFLDEKGKLSTLEGVLQRLSAAAEKAGMGE